MFRHFFNSRIKKFEQKYNYDASYLHFINQHSPSAVFKLSLLSAMNGQVGPSLELWAGAALAGTLSGDCGPCAQLCIERVTELGVSEAKLIAALKGDWKIATDVGLGFQFAKSVTSDKHQLEELRQKVLNRFGEHGLIAASFAAASFQVYPLLKHSLGKANVCQSVTIGDQSIIVN